MILLFEHPPPDHGRLFLDPPGLLNTLLNLGPDLDKTDDIKQRSKPGQDPSPVPGAPLQPVACAREFL